MFNIKNLVFFIIVVFVGCASPTLQIDEPPNIELTKEFDPQPWEPILTLAPVAKPASVEERIYAHRETGYFLQSLLMDFTLSKSTQKLWDSIWKSVETLSIRKLYELEQSQKSTGGWHRFFFRGGRVFRKYYLAVGPKYKNKNFVFAEFGQIRGVASIKPASKNAKNLFLFRSALEMDIGDLSWDSIRDFLVQTMQIMDAKETYVKKLPQSFSKTVQKKFLYLNDDSLLLMAKVIRAFPNFMSVFPHFAIFESLVTRKKRGWTDVNMILRLNRKYIQQHYPQISRFIKLFEGLLEAHFVLKDDNNNQLLSIKLDTRTFHLQLRCALSKGKLVRKKPNGQLLFKAVDLHANSGRFQWQVKNILRTSGITIEISDLKFMGRYDRVHNFASFVLNFRQPPKVKAKGALWGFIPVWAIDFAIPSNLEELAVKFFKILASGKGMRTEISYARGSTKGRMIFRNRTQLEDSGFMGFLMGLARKRFVSNPKRKLERKKLIGSLVQAVQKDFDLLARYYKVKLWKAPQTN